MATAIIRPTAHIDHSSSSYVINNMAYMYDNNNDTYAQGKSSLYGYGVLTGFKPTQLQIEKINKITLCVYGCISGSSGSDAKAKIVYGATSTTAYTDCGDDNLTIALSGSTPTLYRVEYPEATTYWNNNISSFLNGDLQVRLTNIIGVKHLHEVYVEVDYTVPTITVTVNATPTEGGTVTGGGTYESGSTVTATATPNDGYVFSHWLLNGADSGVTEPTISGTFTSDMTVTAVFEKVETSKVYCGTQKVSVYCGTQKVSVYCGTQKLT